MEIVEKAMVETNRTVDIICNKCLSSCQNEYGNYEGIIEKEICGGYGSKIGDCDRYVFSLCEKCLMDLFKSFYLDAYQGNDMAGSLYDADHKYFPTDLKMWETISEEERDLLQSPPLLHWMKNYSREILIIWLNDILPKFRCTGEHNLSLLINKIIEILKSQ